MSKRLIKPVIPETSKRLRHLVDFLEGGKEERRGKPILRTSPYYQWLAYSIIRRELFEEVRQWITVPDRLHSSLIQVWQEFKEYELDGRVRTGIMHEVLYWLASLKLQAECSDTFYIAPIHEGIPRIKRKGQGEDEEVQFRGDFCVFWGKGGSEARAAVVDVKSHYWTATGDKGLVKTARQYRGLGLQFLVASPRVTVSDFDQMRESQYLLDMAHWWEHRPVELRGHVSGPYPQTVVPPWLRSAT